MNFPLLSHYEVGNEYYCHHFIDKKTNSGTSHKCYMAEARIKPLNFV